MEWFSAYVYYYEKQDIFLTKFVKGLVSYLYSNGDISSFFFIRHWDGGPHLRLRFLSSSAEHLKERIEESTLNYISKYPSNVTIDSNEYVGLMQQYAQLETQNSFQQLRPDNSIEYIDYEPEIHKFGGTAAVVIAHRIFEVSWKYALTLLDFEGARRVLLAVVLMELGIHAFQLEGAPLKTFLQGYMHWWGSYLKDEFWDTRIGALQRQFQCNSDEWSNRVSGEKKNPAFNVYTAVMGEAFRDLTSLSKTSGLMEPPCDVLPNLSDPINYRLAHFLHLTNNRLGLRPIDDWFACYILNFRKLAEGYI